MQDLAERLRQFAVERDWTKFHSPKNLSMAVAVEAAELMEHFQWLTEAESLSLSRPKRDAVAEEVADVLLYLLRLSDRLGIDLLEAAYAKLRINSQKYPAELARGRHDKYTAYSREGATQEGEPFVLLGDGEQPNAGLPEGVAIRPWAEGDWRQVRELALRQDWTSYRDDPERVLDAWRNSRPALVAVADGAVIGFLRALTDGLLTVYVGELAVAEAHRGRGIARALIDACHCLYPEARLDVLASVDAQGFYQRIGFRGFSGHRKSGAEFDAG